MSAEPIPSPSSYRLPTVTTGGRLRLRAHQLARDSAARLRRAAARAGGEDGLAFACVLLDMIKADRSQSDWPVSELLDGEPARDRQVLVLLTSLRRIEADIDLVVSPDEVGADPARSRAG